MKRKTLVFTLMAGLAVCWVLSDALAIKEVPRMTKEELKGLIGATDLVIVDVRASGDWEDSDSKIQGAVREDPRNVDEWIGKYQKDKKLVFYCA
jgi:hypothetical protein